MPVYRFQNGPNDSFEVNAPDEATARAIAISRGSNGQLATGGGGGGAPAGTDLASLQKFFGETSGFSREELAEKKRQADQLLAFERERMERIGLPELAIKQRLADLEEKQFQESVAMARAGQGLEYLKFASQLSGPADYFQSADLMRGAQQRQEVPMFLQALDRNITMPAFNAPGGAPEAQTAGALAARLMGAAAPAGPYTTQVEPSAGPTRTPPGPVGGATPGNNDAALASIASIFQRGAQGLGPQALEQLDKTEMGLLTSGGRKLGYDVPAWLQQYERSRIGQRAARAY